MAGSAWQHEKNPLLDGYFHGKEVEDQEEKVVYHDLDLKEKTNRLLYATSDAYLSQKMQQKSRHSLTNDNVNTSLSVLEKPREMVFHSHTTTLLSEDDDEDDEDDDEDTNPFASLLKQQEHQQHRQQDQGEREENEHVSSSSTSSSPRRTMTKRRRLRQGVGAEQVSTNTTTTTSISVPLSSPPPRRCTWSSVDQLIQQHHRGGRGGHFETAEARPSRWTNSNLSSNFSSRQNMSSQNKRKLTRQSLDSFNNRSTLNSRRRHSLNVSWQQQQQSEEGQQSSNGLRLSDVLTQVTRLVQQEEQDQQDTSTLVNNNSLLSANESKEEEDTNADVDGIEDTLQNFLEEPYEPRFFSPPPVNIHKRGHRKKTATMELTNQLKKIKGPLGPILLKACAIDQRERTLLWSMKNQKEMLLTQRPYVIVCLQKQVNNELSTSKGMCYFEATMEQIELFTDKQVDSNSMELTKYHATIDSYQQMIENSPIENDGHMKRRVMVVFINQIASTIELTVSKKVQIFAPFFFIPISLEEQTENCPLVSFFLMGTNQSQIVYGN